VGVGGGFKGPGTRSKKDPFWGAKEGTESELAGDRMISRGKRVVV